MLFSARGRALMKMEKIELPTETKKMVKQTGGLKAGVATEGEVDVWK
jgi:hypothetical protein